MSIISLFSCVVPSFTKQLQRDLELVAKTSSIFIPNTKPIVDFAAAAILNPWVILYNLEAKTLLITLLHMIED